MDLNLFAELLLRVTPRITKCPRSRRPLEPGMKLAITLRFLVRGNSYRSLAYDFRVAHNSISTFVPEVCTAIYKEYKEKMFNMAYTQDEWKAVARQFGTRWKFHHCCGAIDGKHIAIKKTNYKRFCSVVLLAIVDANYSFLWCKVGANGSSSDAGVFNKSTLRGALEDNTTGFPVPDPLPGDDRDFPYFIVGDDAFPLRKWLLKPYSRRAMTQKERVMNYRTHRVVENGFGILAHRWRCLLTTLQLEPGRVIYVVLGCLTLHNRLRKRRPGLQDLNLDREDEDGNVVPGAWREDVQMTEPNRMVGQRASREGKTLRNYLADYYSSPLGRLPWQDRVV
eukprot:XP_003729473.1 PREDICTED: putative nuclease HARBI1 [Strongylocentrotus purpuratus]